MNSLRLVSRSLIFYWRSHLAVLFGVAVATAAIVGALMIGDSIRSSLRRMTIERLGKIDSALVANRFIRHDFADDLSHSDEFKKNYAAALPAIILRGSVENADSLALARKVNVLGVTPQFWDLDVTGASYANEEAFKKSMTGRNVILNTSLAREIGAKVGDAILIRLDKPENIPVESVGGRRDERIRTLRLDVGAIIPNEGLGRLGLMAGQQLPMNIFVPLPTIQRALEQRDQINAVFAATENENDFVNDAGQRLQPVVQQIARLEDLGLRLRKIETPGYLSIESLRMVLNDREIEVIEEIARKGKDTLSHSRTLTYLANSISVGEKSIPYSTVGALDFADASGLNNIKLVDGSPVATIGANELLLNTWAADDLGAKVGDTVTLTYYVEGKRGVLDTAQAEFTLRGIVKMEGSGLDPNLTPEYPGIQNATRISDWDPPFPVDLTKVREKDEAYWKDHRATPKAFISLERGLGLWTSRFGSLTSVRIGPSRGLNLDQVSDFVDKELRSRLSAETSGLVFQPVKEIGLRSSGGATDFAGLFIGFSFFIIISALMLVRLFFSLAVERRAREIGVLMAAGYNAGKVRNLFMVEGLAIALSGSVIGLACGVAYAALMIYGLRTWWVSAVGTSFLWLDVTPQSLIYGFLGGLLTGALSIFLAVRRLTSAEPTRLLSGNATLVLNVQKGRRRWGRTTTLALGVPCAVGSFVAAFFVDAGTQAALFYVSGISILVVALALFSVSFEKGWGRAHPGGLAPLVRLGMKNASRNSSRSLLTIGLMASATFIIIAVGANRHDAGAQPIRKDSGNGGYALMAEADVPILHDLNNPETRKELGFDAASSSAFGANAVHPLRLNPGEDASCLNLYRPAQPRILGAPAEFIERGGFRFQSSQAEAKGEKENPWLLLNREIKDTKDIVPVIADANTVMWILHSGLGKSIEIEDEGGRSIAVQFVGLLKGSALQSELIMSEENFKRLFPSRAGYQVFFIETDPPNSARLEAALETGLRDFGLDAYPTQQRINSYLAVEHTYLSTFQALGGVGLLLGVFGLAAVMLRNIVERRGELALLRSFGYSNRDLGVLVMAENGFLLVAGLVTGAGAALLSVAPHLIGEASQFPWISLSLTLLAVMCVGLIAGLLAVASAVRSPILDALRSE